MAFLSGCGKKTPSVPITAGPTPVPYVLDDMESGINDWVNVVDSLGNLDAEPAIISPGNSGSYGLTITYTVETEGASAPYEGRVYSFKLPVCTNVIYCSADITDYVLTGGPALTGYTALKFDAKIAASTMPAAGTLAYSIRIKPNRPCGGTWDKYAEAPYTPGTSWSEISIPISSLTVTGTDTLAQILDDIYSVEFDMSITSPQLGDNAVVVLYLDNIRFE